MVVLQCAVTMKFSMSIVKRFFDDIPVIVAQSGEVTVNIVAEPECSTAMESALPKLSHVVPIKSIPFASKSSVKVVKVDCCSLTMILII